MNKYAALSLAALLLASNQAVSSGADAAVGATAPATPTTQPQSARSSPSTANVPPPMPAPRRRMFDGPPPTAEQVHDAEAFAETNSPNRYHAYKRFTENGQTEFRDRIRGAIVRGYLEMHAVSREDPDLYEMKLNEMKLEDQIWGAVAEYRRRAETGGGQVSRADLRESIRPQFRELLELRRKQAEHRIERMQSAIRDEQARLEKLKRVTDDSLNARLDQEIEYGGIFRNAFGPGGPGGGLQPRPRDPNPAGSR